MDLSKQKELDADPRSIQQIEFIDIVETAQMFTLFWKNQKKLC